MLKASMATCGTLCLPECGTQEKCTLCECTKIDARVCLPCNHQFCYSCVSNNTPPDCPTMTSCPKCCYDVDRHRRRVSPDCLPKTDPCSTKEREEKTNDFFCYNCIKERGPDCRVQAKKFCLDCDVPLCENHLKQHKTFIKKKQHTMLPISQYMLTKKKFEQRKCRVHPKHNLMFVCNKCDVILCQVCVACCDCEKGGRHEAKELDIVALEMAAKINQKIKDVDCFRLGGEQAIITAQKEQQKLDCELERLKKDIRCQYQEKIAELQRRKEEACQQLGDISKRNIVLTKQHRDEITTMVREAVKVAKEAKKLLCYSHNVDIATQAEKTQQALNCVKNIAFPCLNLVTARIGSQSLETNIPSLTYDDCSKKICPQPCIPQPQPQDQCDRCTRAPNPCPPASSAYNPTIKSGDLNCSDPCAELMRSITCDDPCPPMRGTPLLNNCPSESSTDECKDPRLKGRVGKFLGSWTNCYEEDDDGCGNDRSYHTAQEPIPMDVCLTSKEKLAFTIKDASNLTTDKSLPCSINGLCWTLVVSVKRVDCDMWLGIFLTCKAPGGDCRSFSCKVEDLRLSIIDQCNPKKSVCKKISSHCFTETDSNWGVQSVCCWADIINPRNNFRLDNTLRVKAEFNIYPVKWC